MPIPADIDFTQTYVRFVNAISNAQPMTLFAKSTVSGTEVPIGSTVAYKSAGAFVCNHVLYYGLHLAAS